VNPRPDPPSEPRLPPLNPVSPLSLVHFEIMLSVPSSLGECAGSCSQPECDPAAADGAGPRPLRPAPGEARAAGAGQPGRRRVTGPPAAVTVQVHWDRDCRTVLVTSTPGPPAGPAPRPRAATLPRAAKIRAGLTISESRARRGPGRLGRRQPGDRRTASATEVGGSARPGDARTRRYGS
jgi:hypothetical protein